MDSPKGLFRFRRFPKSRPADHGKPQKGFLNLMDPPKSRKGDAINPRSRFLHFPGDCLNVGLPQKRFFGAFWRLSQCCFITNIEKNTKLSRPYLLGTLGLGPGAADGGSTESPKCVFGVRGSPKIPFRIYGTPTGRLPQCWFCTFPPRTPQKAGDFRG